MSFLIKKAKNNKQYRVSFEMSSQPIPSQRHDPDNSCLPRTITVLRHTNTHHY